MSFFSKMAPPASLFSPAPYHILSYGTLLGATVFQTFINQNVLFGIISFPLPVELSKRLLPRYYLLQTLLPVVMALTYPSSRGIRALWDAGNRKTAMLPMAWMFVTALANWAVVSPVAIEFVEESGNFALMSEALRNARASKDKLEMTRELAEDKLMSFTIMQAFGGVLNMGTLFAAVRYGFTLASRL